MNELFEIDPTAMKRPDHAGTGKRCNQCKHGQGWVCGSKIIWYCWERASSRTDNGRLKIKAKQAACSLFEGKQ